MNWKKVEFLIYKIPQRTATETVVPTRESLIWNNLSGEIKITIS